MADVEKRYPATPHRRREARQRGQVAKSIEVNTVIVLMGGVILLRFLSRFMFENLKEITYRSFTFLPPIDIGVSSVLNYAPGLLVRILVIIIPFCLGLGIVALVANLMQVGFLSSWTVIKPQLDRINPISGLKRLFSYRALVELIKSLMKIVITIWVAYVVLKSHIPNLVYTISMVPNQSVYVVGKLIFSLVIRIGLALGALAILDYFFQRWEYEKSLRMSRQELKEELLRYEGRPEVKQRIRALQRQYAQRRMMQEVARADVVITNPTHLAVAIRYDPKESAAPRVVAKGARLIAQKIVTLAKEHGVPVVENKPLAQALFKMVEVGQIIPVALYQAIAEVLAYLYRIGKAKRKWV